MRAIIIILAMLFSGCTTTKPSVVEYRVAIDTLKINNIATGCKDKSLKISDAFSSNSLMSLNMDYTESNNRVFSYSQSQWQESPNSFITMELLKSIRNSGLFESVHSLKSRIKSNLILETNIEEFMQFYSEDMKESHVNIAVSLTLVDAKTNVVISTKTFNSKVAAKSLDAKGGADAVNLALFEIISQNIEWLSGVCK